MRSYCLVAFVWLGLFSKAQQDTHIDLQSDEPVYTITEQEPEFPGGPVAMSKYFSTGLPEDSLKAMFPTNFYRGTAYIKFIVEPNGAISQVELLKGTRGCNRCDEAALDLITKMPLWQPGIAHGKPVRSYVTLPVNFKIQ